MKITTLIENRASETNPDLAAEWGLSLHIEFDSHSILFDTGSSGAFADNAKKLSIKIDSIDTAVLSHQHFDHGGGLERFFSLNSKAKVYLADAPIDERYIKLFGFFKKYIGLNHGVMDKFQDRFRAIGKPTEILPDVFIFPHIVNTHPRPIGNKQLLVKKNGELSPDDFSHELVMAVRENDQLVIFTGCSHNGILNMIDTVAKEFDRLPIKAVIGGFHIVSSPPFHSMAGTRKEVEDLGRAVLNYPVKMTYTGHCTGTKAFTVLKSVMNNRLTDIRTGSCFEI